MSLEPDPSRKFKVNPGEKGVSFAMFDGEKRVDCLVAEEALRDAAAEAGTDQEDIRSAFENHRDAIERAASRRYSAGQVCPIVRSEDIR
jgi:hypothetical protein